jgi:hypothetical protein
LNNRNIATPASEPTKRLYGYLPVRPETFAALVTFLKQSQRALTDPTAPAPNTPLLTHEWHGPFRSIRVKDEVTGQGGIEFSLRNPDRKPRLMKPAAAFLLLRLHLAFGGGCSVNDTGTGLGYIKLYSDREGIILDRLVTDASRDEIALHKSEAGERTDYHNIDATFRSKVPSAPVAGGRKQRSPHRGRQEAIKTALRYYERNHRRSGIKLTKGEYELLLKEAYALLDALIEAVE